MSRRLAAPALLAVLPLALGAACGGPAIKKPADLGSMVRIPAGQFLMGRDDGEPDERPQHPVWLDEFFLDRTEVTNAAFKRFCDASGYLYPNNPAWDDDYFLGQPGSPVLNVSWEQARAYCAWAGKRLPTEAEWEKAARGTNGRKYPWGTDWADSTANLHGEPYEHAAPAGSFPKGTSPYGVLDLAGNVWEWCADWYEQGAYATAAVRNPLGPPGPTPWRVVRGGGYTSPKTDAEAANRSKNPPAQIIHHLGCRCAWSPR